MKKYLEQDMISNATSSLTNFQIKKYYQNEPKFNGVYWRNNLLKIKNGAYVTNLNWYESMETNWNGNNGTHMWMLITKEHLLMHYISIALELTNDYEKNDKLILKYF